MPFNGAFVVRQFFLSPAVFHLGVRCLRRFTRLKGGGIKGKNSGDGRDNRMGSEGRSAIGLERGSGGGGIRAKAETKAQ